MIAKKIVQTSHCFRAKFNLKITFLGKGKVRVNRRFRRDADTDNMSSIIPVNFGKKCRIEVQAIPFRWHVPNAIGVNFMAFRQIYLE